MGSGDALIVRESLDSLEIEAVGIALPVTPVAYSARDISERVQPLGSRRGPGNGKRAAVQSLERTVTASRDPLAGGGVCGELMRSIDWSRTPVGPVES